MNLPATKLSNIAGKKSRIIIGLMSGTSLDGLDIALCRIEGAGFDTKTELLAFETKTYTDETKERILKIFAKEQISFPLLIRLHKEIGLLHADMVLNFLAARHLDPRDVDLIGSHGQTIFHLPASSGNSAATFQIGDADHIATGTGIITVSDFRQQHIAAGGEGAPLAPYGDLLLFKPEDKNRIFINIGGISNFSLIQGKKILFSDIGPGNTLLDQVARLRLNRAYDMNGAIASKGKLIEPVLTALLDEKFLGQPIPKTTGPELFNAEWLEKKSPVPLRDISSEDLLHTLSEFTALTISYAIRNMKTDPANTEIFFSGGGIHNDFLMEMISKKLQGYTSGTTKDLGIDPDAKEAILFALLANESVAGDPDIFRDSNLIRVRMGKISFPGTQQNF